jgi:glutaconate CoA-transferase, subunit A
MKKVSLMDKRLSSESAAALVASGSTLALGGMTLYRRPMAFVRALLQRHRQTGEPTGLTLLNFTAGLESDMLLGAGLVRRVRSCYFGLEIFGLAPMYTYLAGRGEIEIIEETEASLALGLRAQMSGIGFMPGRAWTGTDLPKLRPDVKIVIDPYTGEELMAFPAIKPDVAVIHALVADYQGNAQIGGNQAIDSELALSAGTVIVTAEKIVPDLDKANLIAPLVQAVVEAPGGARPTSCHPAYPLDGEAIMAYTDQVNDPNTFQSYLENWLSNSE